MKCGAAINGVMTFTIGDGVMLGYTTLSHTFLYESRYIQL